MWVGGGGGGGASVELKTKVKFGNRHATNDFSEPVTDQNTRDEFLVSLFWQQVSQCIHFSLMRALFFFPPVE